ncbi:MAG: biotin-dependent carboxyltransferase family protein [Candidatus Ventricola sp.]
MNILFPGPLSTVQDMGRTGCAAQGYPECGACDKYALALGNLLCGNPETAAAVEMTLSGATVQFDQDAVIALTGASCTPTLNGQGIPLYAPVRIPAGATLETGMFTAGLRAYLCVRGGVEVKPVLGSRSTDQKCHIGGLEGRALRSGDRLPIGQPAPGYAFDRAVRAARILADKPWLLRPRTAHSFLPGQAVPLLRAVPGPQDDAFTSEGLHTFFSDMYTVTTDSNRMGVKLSGPAVAAKDGSDILSDGIVEGSVQISSNGQPILMLADHQTTGGYAKVATVIAPDLSAAAQLRPGELAAFRPVTAAQAVRLCRETAQQLCYIKELIQHD